MHLEEENRQPFSIQAELAEQHRIALAQAEDVLRPDIRLTRFTGCNSRFSCPHKSTKDGSPATGSIRGFTNQSQTVIVSKLTSHDTRN